MTTEQQNALPKGLPIPVPGVDGLGTEFWDATRRHELLVQRCNGCRNWQWGPEHICYQCHSWDLTYEPVEPTGVIYSWERVWHPVHPALVNALPYMVVLVELPQAGNVRMVGNLVGQGAEIPIEIGQNVEAVFEDHNEDGDKYTLVQWRLSEKV